MRLKWTRAAGVLVATVLLAACSPNMDTSTPDGFIRALSAKVASEKPGDFSEAMKMIDFESYQSSHSRSEMERWVRAIHLLTKRCGGIEHEEISVGPETKFRRGYYTLIEHKYRFAKTGDGCDDADHGVYFSRTWRLRREEGLPYSGSVAAGGFLPRMSSL